jgi:hypothetical protein
MVALEFSPRGGGGGGGRAWSREARDNVGALLCREARSKAKGHVAALEPTSARRGGVRCRRTHGSVEAHLSKEVGFGAVGHMTALKPTSAKRWGPVPWDTW